MATLIFFSCENPSAIGLELNPNENNVGVYEKEFTLPSSVILNDSINTSLDSRLMVGRFKDPFFGEVVTKSFSQVTRDGEFVGINTKGVLDSIQFNFEVAYVHGEYGAFFQTVSVHQLTDTLFAGLRYFADDTTKYNSRNAVASKTFIYSPSKDTILRMKAEPFWAAEIFNKVLDGTDVNELRNDIKGFALIPGKNNTFVFGFDPAKSYLSMHYHTETADSLEYRLTFSNAEARYTNIVVDRTGTELEGLSEAGDEIVPPSGKVYVQPGTGIHTKISLEPVRNFVDSLGHIVVNRAELIIGPNDPLTSLEYYIKPPSTLAFIRSDSAAIKFWSYYYTNIDNLWKYVVMSDPGYQNGQQGTQLKLFSNVDTTGTYKSVPTLFTQYLRDDLIDIKDLVLYPTDHTSLNRFIIPADKIRFKIFYTNLD